jgi:hypothetical protein
MISLIRSWKVTSMVEGGMDFYTTSIMEAEYARARRRAAGNALKAAIRRQSNRLHSLREIDGKFIMDAEHYLGVRQVTVRCIVGSMARYHDFDRDFNPLHDNNRERWKRVAGAQFRGITLPPVQLLKVGDAYLVRDGNHRVSVARHYGVEQIDAEVTEFVTPCSLSRMSDPALTAYFTMLFSKVRGQAYDLVTRALHRRESELCTCCQG